MTKLTQLGVWRRRKGLRLEEVAGLTGLSASMLCRVESGQRQLAPLTKVQVARALGEKISELFPVEPLVEQSYDVFEPRPGGFT